MEFHLSIYSLKCFPRSHRREAAPWSPLDKVIPCRPPLPSLYSTRSTLLLPRGILVPRTIKAPIYLPFLHRRSRPSCPTNPSRFRGSNCVLFPLLCHLALWAFTPIISISTERYFFKWARERSNDALPLSSSQGRVPIRIPLLLPREFL